MASILTSPIGTPPEEPKPQRWDSSADGEFLTPHVLLQLEDELERVRRREAAWISIMVHLLVVLLLINTTKLFPNLRGPIIASAADLMKNQQLTYLDLPPDLQKAPPKPPPTNVISDKNRTAESRHPQLDKKTLEELRRAGPPGGRQAPPQAQQAQAPPSQQPGQGQAQPQQGTQQQVATNSPPVLQDPRLAVPQQGTQKPTVDFRSMMSPGQQISQAANNVAMGRTAPSVGFGGSVGGGGDYGAGRGGAARVQGNLEVLTDTQGVDFGPYLARVLQAVRMNWYAIIPESARPPLLKRGKVSIEFVILPNGKVAGLKNVGSSGDVALDRAAWGGITASDPFAPLPSAFHGPYLGLRFHFYYNPQKGDME